MENETTFTPATTLAHAVHTHLRWLQAECFDDVQDETEALRFVTAVRPSGVIDLFCYTDATYYNPLGYVTKNGNFIEYTGTHETYPPTYWEVAFALADNDTTFYAATFPEIFAA